MCPWRQGEVDGWRLPSIYWLPSLFVVSNSISLSTTLVSWTITWWAVSDSRGTVGSIDRGSAWHLQLIHAADRSNQRSEQQWNEVNVHSLAGIMMLLDAPRMTIKTYLINLILSVICSHIKVFSATASSGNAVILIKGSRMLHVMFKIPLDAHRQKHSGWD